MAEPCSPSLADEILVELDRHRRPITVRRLQRAIGDVAYGRESMFVMGLFVSVPGLSPAFAGAVRTLVLDGRLAFVQGPRKVRLTRNRR
jgi:hypothetical protein